MALRRVAGVQDEAIQLAPVTAVLALSAGPRPASGTLTLTIQVDALAVGDYEGSVTVSVLLAPDPG